MRAGGNLLAYLVYSGRVRILLAAAVLCLVVGIIIVLAVLSNKVPISVAGPIYGGGFGLIIFGVFFLIFAFLARYITPSRHDEVTIEAWFSK
jgi:hypothetical protein